MDDVRNTFNTKKNKFNGLGIISWVVRNKKVFMWLFIIFVGANIIVNPVNTATRMVDWFNDFFGTIINGL